MITGADKITKEMVKLALDAASMRHNAIANNLANIHSAAYVPLRVNFEEQLHALQQAVDSKTPLTPEALTAIRPFVEPDPDLPAGSAASMIDREMLKLSQNTVHYQALLKALAKRGAIMSLVINEGRK